MRYPKFAIKRSFSTASIALLLILSLQSLVASAATLDIENVRVARSGEVTRVVFDTNYIPKYKIFTLNNPSRIVIDFFNGRLINKVDQSVFKSSYVQRMRHAQRKNEKLRVVLDLNQPIIPKSFILPPNNGSNHRLVIDLTGSGSVSAAGKSKSGAGLTKPAVKTTKAVSAKANVPVAKHTAKQDIIAKVTSPPKPKSKISKDPAITTKKSTSKLRDIVIAIDPGHGGKDPGATGYAGTREKHVVLQISKRLARLINAQSGMRAVLTRDNDQFLTLRGRIKKARQQKADIFVSVHADAVDDRRVRGSSVYVLSKHGASSEAAKILAQRQNNADVIGGVSLKGKDKVLQKVIVDLSQTATIDASVDLARQVLNELSRLGKTRKRIENAGFAVLKSPDIPSILVETAFISNATEERRLRSPEHQQKLANSIFRGIRSYLNQNPPENSLLAHHAPRDKHTIRSGETLSGIAQRYRVSLDSLRSINALRNDTIRVGQKLIIPEV